MNEKEIELLRIIGSMRVRNGQMIDMLKAIGTFSLGSGEQERLYLPQKEMLRIIAEFEDSL